MNDNRFKKVSVFLPSSFQNGSRIENVDGSPMPLLEVKAWAFTDAELAEVRRDAAELMLKEIQRISNGLMDKWIEQKFDYERTHPFGQ